MKTALITGANGFLGSHLVANLASSGWNVITTMRKEPDNASGEWSNIGKIIFTGDIGAYNKWDEALGGVDVVVHLAALAHDTSANKKWTSDDYMRVNAGATLDIARAAAKAGVKRFIFISTIKVNGESTPVDKPFDETSPTKPSDPYGASKLMAENSLREIARKTGMEIVIIRPPLVYGRGVRGNMGALIDIVNRKRFVPAPATNNLRSFVYAGNLADAIRLCMEHPKAGGHTLVASDGEDISTINLIRLIAKSIEGGAVIIPVPAGLLRLAGAAGDAIAAIADKQVVFNSASISKVLSSLRVDSSKIREKLGWSPPFTLEEGIIKTIGA